ncbi:MAG: hypothetical protein IPM54_39530 [Polyangiaceae bacterium]|nr:hypothetical protein [Polyangiaceae bacterium]
MSASRDVGNLDLDRKGQLQRALEVEIIAPRTNQAGLKTPAGSKATATSLPERWRLPKY